MLESPLIDGDTYRFDVIAVAIDGELGQVGHAVAIVGHRATIAPGLGQLGGVCGARNDLCSADRTGGG